MARGGTRSGAPNRQYPERRDMQRAPRTAGQPVRAAAGQAYGERGAQEAAQRAMPLPRKQTAASAQPQGPTGPPPGGLTPLDAPTARPGEPITAGLPIGPGPGPEILGGIPNDPVDVLRGILQEDPDNDAVRALVSLADQGF